MNEPIRNPTLGRVISGVGVLLAIASFYTAKKGTTTLDLDPSVALGFLFIGLPLGAVLVVLGNSLASRDAATVMREDDRPPVLFLRSFQSDGVRLARSTARTAVALVSSYSSPFSLEEVMQEAFEPVGPMVAIGKPGEVLATPGAARSYVADDEWQRVVRDWMRKASVVIVELGGSDGLWWELRAAFTAKEPSRILLFVDPKKVRGKAGSYENLMMRAEQEIGRPLPRSPGEAAFIWFDDDGQPVRLESKTVPWWTGRKAEMRGDGKRRDQSTVSTLKPIVDRYRNNNQSESSEIAPADAGSSEQ